MQLRSIRKICDKHSAKISRQLTFFNGTILGSKNSTRNNNLNGSQRVNVTYTTRGNQGVMMKFSTKLSRFKIRTLKDPRPVEVVVKDEPKR